MIPVGLNLCDKNILLVGGGHVAFRKAHLFLKESANITMVSPSFLEDGRAMDITFIEDLYDKKYLKDMFLVYACTDHQQVNQQVVDDCNELHILCGSATKANGVSFHSMAFETNTVGTVAISTHQKMPYTKPLIREFGQLLSSHERQLELLGVIRNYLVKTKQISSLLLEKLYEVNEDVLQFIVDSILVGKGYIFVYHQSDYPQHYDFDLSPKIILSLVEFEKIQSVLEINIDFEVIPLLLSDGYIYQKLKKMTTLKVAKPLITSIEDVQTIIALLRHDNQKNYWVLHPRSKSNLLNSFQEHVPEGDVVQTFDDPFHFEKDTNAHVVVLLMTEGGHYHDLIKNLPTNISVSQILPLEKQIKNYLQEEKK